MKSTFIRISLFVGLFCFLNIQANSQRVAEFWWFDAGAKFGYGATALYNSAIGDSNEWGYDITTGYNVGGKIGINKGVNGFTIDIMYANAVQGFEDKRIPGEVLEHEVKWNSYDLYTLYRNNRQLGYVEIGPKFSFINEVETKDSEGNVEFPTSQFAENNIGLVLGFGAYFIGSDSAFSGIMGLRMEYGLTDFVNAKGHEMGQPVPDVGISNPGVNTSPIFAGIVFELNWGLGYYGKASCGARSKFIKF